MGGMEEMNETRGMYETKEQNKSVNMIGVLFLLIFMLVLSTKAFSAVSAASYSATINSIVSSYESRLAWDDSVPRVNWKANEASMKHPWNY